MESEVPAGRGTGPTRDLGGNSAGHTHTAPSVAAPGLGWVLTGQTRARSGELGGLPAEERFLKPEKLNHVFLFSFGYRI